jgi:hypothetical protein
MARFPRDKMTLDALQRRARSQLMFDIRQTIFDRHGEVDEQKVEDYTNGLMEEFAASPEARPLLDSGAGVGWAASMMDYAINHLGTTPAEMSMRDFNEVVFDLIPRKVSVEPERAPEIVNELQAFWQFVLRQYALPHARPILDALQPPAAQRLQDKLADPSNYGMAKSFFMMGHKAGFDMTTQEGLDQFQAVYNSRLLANRAVPPLLPDSAFDSSLPLANPPSRDERAARRVARKRQRQARKRNRR